MRSNAFINNWPKSLIRVIRDKAFSLIENCLIHFFKRIPKISGGREETVFFSPRAGRGLQSSEVDDLFFRTYPETRLSTTKRFKYNSRFWIMDSIKILILQCLNPNQKLILIQYVHGFHVSPSIKLLEYLQDQGVVIVKFWLDAYSDSLWDKRINRISHLGRLNIIVDTPVLKKDKFMAGNTYYYKPIPVEITPTVNFSDRKFLIYYSGGIDNGGMYQPRKLVIDFLNENNLYVHGTAYDRDKPIQRPDYNTYRGELSNSLIGLNFTWKGEDEVLVARTWEILSSGVLLIQNKSQVLQGLLVPGIHYLEFSNNLELLETIKDLQDNPDIISRIALAGKRRYEELFSAEVFWALALQ